MRSAGNFSPEWGYLAPAPSFMRTARIVLVATAVGATAGAGVVLSLMDHPAADGGRTSSVAAHAIVTSVEAATAAAAPVASAPVTASARVPANALPASQAKLPVPPKPAQAPAASGPGASLGASETTSAPQSPAPGIAALSDPASAATPTDLPDGTTLELPAPAPKKTAMHHSANSSGAGLGTTLRQLFSAHAGTSYYPGRGL
jgi:hypothetical protein